jgi:leucyl aminopeptidase
MFEIIPARFTARTARKNNVVFVETKCVLPEEAARVDEVLGGQLARILKNSGFKGEKNSIETIVGLDHQGVESVIAVGVGKLSRLTRPDWLQLGIRLAQKLDSMMLKDISVLLGSNGGQAGALEAAQAFIEGLHMGSYRFEQFKSEPKPASSVKKMTLFTDGRTARQLGEDMDRLVSLMEAQAQARDMVNLPPNVANPQYMADEAAKLGKLGLKVKVLDEKELTKLGMNLMMAVGKGAAKADQPRLILMEYQGAGKDDPWHALVGKGVMFDTGGYNIKPGKYMQTMKADMGGAAAVFGTMRAIAQRKPKINIIGVMGCAMNMIGPDAYTDDMVFTGYNGKTVEIGHTDAEGRMVLADSMAYTIDKYKPREVIDLATLTGAILVALAGKYAGLFSDTDRLANALHKAGETTGEMLWRMPVDDDFLAKSDVADMNNDGSPYGGSSVAALFLKQFVGTTPWAHLDIAGVAFADKGGDPKRFSTVKGATGFGVRLLVNYLEAEAEKIERPVRKGRKKRGRR